ncbi:MAG: hypothetical protein IJ077_09845 [Eubacterium sp.]|nr:hypothetical protein [Eubacterium sp.]
MQDARYEYGDIIDLPHHQSDKRAHMSLHDRAAQFAPFAALRGYDDEIAETARLTDARRELSSEDVDLINERLHIIIDNIASKPFVQVTHFVADDKKDGGAYVNTSGNVRRVDEVQRAIIFTDGKFISIDDILRIDGEIFN